MHQTRKGQQWYFGMKLHIGVDSQSGLAHSAVVTAANVHDKWVMLAVLNVGFFLLAAVMDEIAIMVILGPMLMAALRANGGDEKRSA